MFSLFAITCLVVFVFQLSSYWFYKFSISNLFTSTKDSGSYNLSFMCFWDRL